MIQPNMDVGHSGLNFLQLQIMLRLLDVRVTGAKRVELLERFAAKRASNPYQTIEYPMFISDPERLVGKILMQITPDAHEAAASYQSATYQSNRRRIRKGTIGFVRVVGVTTWSEVFRGREPPTLSRGVIAYVRVKRILMQPTGEGSSGASGMQTYVPVYPIQDNPDYPKIVNCSPIFFSSRHIPSGVYLKYWGGKLIEGEPLFKEYTPGDPGFRTIQTFGPTGGATPEPSFTRTQTPESTPLRPAAPSYTTHIPPQSLAALERTPFVWHDPVRAAAMEELRNRAQRSNDEAAEALLTLRRGPPR